jgi:hypothetical protein
VGLEISLARCLGSLAADEISKEKPIFKYSKLTNYFPLFNFHTQWYGYKNKALA